MKNKLTKTDEKTIETFGRQLCFKAYVMNETDGEGASTIGVYLSVSTREANALINAGRKLWHEEAAASV
jgi:hypothetical protein